MIRTLIEISAEDQHQHNSQLKETLGKLGYEPKPDAEYTLWMRDVWEVIREQGLDIHKLVEAKRGKRFAESLK